MAAGKRESRFDSHGEIRAMAFADGYVMVRRPGAVPWVISQAQWDVMPKQRGETVLSRG